MSLLFRSSIRTTPGAYGWSVLLGFGTGRERTLAGVLRTYKRVTGKSLVPSSFYDRFTKELARMFRAVLSELMSKLASSEVRYAGVFGRTSRIRRRLGVVLCKSTPYPIMDGRGEETVVRLLVERDGRRVCARRRPRPCSGPHAQAPPP